jgi:hypothetical protein
MHQHQQRHTTDTAAPKPLWRGEYDRIYRLMAARLRAAAEHRPAPEAAASAGDVPGRRAAHPPARRAARPASAPRAPPDARETQS